MQWTQRFVLLGLMAALTPATADEDPWYTDVAPEPWGGEPTEERPVEIPPSPVAKNLLPLDYEYRGYRYFIDRDSLSIDESRRVVRYTVVIESPEGVRNVLFEGIRCGPGDYRTYAYAAGEGPLQAAASSEWNPIRSGSAFGFRRDLREIYLCRGLTPRDHVDEMVRRIQYPPSVNDFGFRD